MWIPEIKFLVKVFVIITAPVWVLPWLTMRLSQMVWRDVSDAVEDMFN